MTSESVANNWISLISLETVHIVILCSIAFAGLLLFVTCLHDFVM